MLVRLLAEQIAYRWNTIKQAIGDTLPPANIGASEVLNNILESLLNGEMQCWVGIEDNKIKGIALTTVITEPGTKMKNLLFFSLVGFGMSDEMYREGLKTFSLFGRSKDCDSIVAYTDSEELVDRAKQLGGNFRYFITFSIGDLNEDI